MTYCSSKYDPVVSMFLYNNLALWKSKAIKFKLNVLTTLIYIVVQTIEFPNYLLVDIDDNIKTILNSLEQKILSSQ